MWPAPAVHIRRQPLLTLLFTCCTQTQAYKSINDVPQARELRIFVDTGAEAVLLPLYGVMVSLYFKCYSCARV